LGSTQGQEASEKRIEAIKIWFKSHEKRFNSLGYYWGDPKLAIGWLPAAELVCPPNSQEEQRELVNFLSKFNQVNSCSFVE